jgi:hypothetical protein
MRSFALLIGFLLSCVVFSQAQEVQMKEESVLFSTGSHHAIVAEIPFGKRAIIEKQLKSELKSWGGKLIISGDEYKVVQGKMKAFGDKHFDGYAKIIETPNEIKVAFAVDLGGKYMTSGEHPAEHRTIHERARNFGVKTAGLGIKADLAADKKALKTLEKQEKEIEKNIESSTKNIESYQKKIKEEQKNIETKNAELSAKQQEIKDQNGLITDRKKKAKKIK